MTLRSIQAAAFEASAARNAANSRPPFFPASKRRDSAELERQWIEEADRRYRAYRSGH